MWKLVTFARRLLSLWSDLPPDQRRKARDEAMQVRSLVNEAVSSVRASRTGQAARKRGEPDRLNGELARDLAAAVGRLSLALAPGVVGAAVDTIPRPVRAAAKTARFFRRRRR